MNNILLFFIVIVRNNISVKGQEEQSEFVKRALEIYTKYLENRFKK
ncbi:hypothetical protein [Clostridium botulinum]|uniref:Uncharacterized protein n=1 Tax=Clostridium botulinum (strain 657 / Type Ba4) TaxID=515621 RepID=A0A3F2ZUC9_CLOB6|nr:hypothetical protein [Clostridium botulinum]ACQ51466.1 conserved hypothetical protein [Clostridium botulinum Ba4 str. 657]